jgi:hypothetical protein
VDEQVRGEAAGVIPIQAPLEEAAGIERTRRGRTDESLPVDRLGRGIRRHGVVPRAGRRVAVHPPVDERHLPQFPRVDDVDRLRVRVDAGPLAADLHDAVLLARRLDDGLALLPPVCHRLLDEHVLAGVHRIERHLLVPVIGDGDDDRLDVLVVEQPPVVAPGAEVGAEDLMGTREVRFVCIGDFHDAGVRDRAGAAEEDLAPDADADDADADTVVGPEHGGVRA